MKFAVSRTSVWSDVKPCENAFKDTYIIVDIRNCDCPSKIPLYGGNKERANLDWLSEGRNHRIENGNIKRDFVGEEWFVEIDNLGELLKFMDDSKSEIIIKNHYQNNDLYALEIYDDYRE